MSKVRDKAFQDYKDGAKISDIAAKYNVSFNTVKSWARRYWKLKQGETVSESHRKIQARPHGAPKGNHNNLIHGAYIKVRHNILKNDTSDIFESIGYNLEPDQILKELIIFYLLQERRLLIILRDLRQRTDLHICNRVTHIAKKKIGNTIVKTVTYIPSLTELTAPVERELTKISRIMSNLAKISWNQQKVNKVSGGLTIKIYNMAETVKRVDKRLKKIIMTVKKTA